MKVFISWSGARSKLLAAALRDWLQPILQSVEVWMSDADIDAGDRWGEEVARELSACNFGILCITPENLAASWLLFEAGALAKSLEGGKVIPLLFDLELREISGPLAQFQAKKFDQSGLKEVASSINRNLAIPIADGILNALLDAMWPGMQQKLEAIPERTDDAKHVRSQVEVLEELVSGVRSFDSRLRDTEMAIHEGAVRGRRRRPRHFLPMMFDMAQELDSNEPIGVLIVAGALREDFPWISEVLSQSYGSIRRGNSAAIGRLLRNIDALSRQISRGFYMDDLGGSKEQVASIIDLPVFLDRYLERFRYEREESTLRRLRVVKEDTESTAG